MRNNTKSPKKQPSALEQLVLEFLWANGPSTADSVREGLLKRHPMKEATARTILRRLEAKGYTKHVEEGRTYVYSSVVGSTNLAMQSIRQIMDRFWGGSVEALVVGMVEQELVDPAELREFADKLEQMQKAKEK